MGSAIGEIIPLAVGVVLSPVPIIAVILMLFTPRARSNSIAFLVGWAGGLLVLGTILLLVAGALDLASDDSGDESTLSGVVKLLLGVLLLLLAVKNWRSRPAEGEEPELPKWMSTLDTFTAGKSLAAGVVLSSLNPKNLALLLAAVGTIAAAGLSAGEEEVVLGIFVFIASLSILFPVGTYLLLGERADARLTPAKDWLARNNAAVMAIILLVFGVSLIGDGIGVLSS